MLYLSRRPRENRDTKNAMTATAAVQRYNRVNIVAALAIALAVSARLCAHRRLPVGDVVHINLARLKRQLSIPGQTAFLEQRITTLLEHLNEGPDVEEEILRLRNEVWLVEAMTWPKGH
jgi:hypothetical protein